ncbi:hypothetical protein OKZ62_001849 [Vibrio navarrensis]|nr:hypothetical protein [Vibrio navarrensis]
MDIHKLAKMSEADIASWVRNNTEKFSLLPNSELEEIINARDDWEERATELASEIGKLLNVEVGEHSSANCPVNNALEAIQYAIHAREKVTALKERVHNVIFDKVEH